MFIHHKGNIPKKKSKIKWNKKEARKKDKNLRKHIMTLKMQKLYAQYLVNNNRKQFMIQSGLLLICMKVSWLVQTNE